MGVLPEELKEIGAQIVCAGSDDWEVQDREGIFVGKGKTEGEAIESAVAAVKDTAHERARNHAPETGKETQRQMSYRLIVGDYPEHVRIEEVNFVLDRIEELDKAEKRIRDYSANIHQRYVRLRGTFAIHQDRENDQVQTITEQRMELDILRPIKEEALKVLKAAGAMTWHGLTLKPLIDALWKLHPMAHLDDASVGKQIESLVAMAKED